MLVLQRLIIGICAPLALAAFACRAEAAVVHLNAGQTLIQVYDFSADPVQPPYKDGRSIYNFPTADGFDDGDAWNMQIFDSANQVIGGAAVSSIDFGRLVGSSDLGQGFTLPQLTNETQITARLTMQTGSMDVDFRLAMRDVDGASTVTLPSGAGIVPLPAALPLFGSALLLVRVRARKHGSGNS